ncbi:MAG: radical SAM protein, partial [Nitrospinae bacterium]|nr:radical SAM protein [Nitrospinota bacterium]
MLIKDEIQARKIPGRIAELVRFPLQRIHIELTNVCNFDCTFCPKQEMTRKYEYMEYERAAAIIDEIAEYRMAEKITFHVMGEPFMHPRFFDILDHAAAVGVKTGITTNGTYLNDEIGARLETMSVSQLNISLQTPDEESFKTRKARRLDFEQYKAKILEFISRCLRHETPPKLKLHFLNTAIQREVPGEDWSLGTMNVINNTKELRRTFAYWANEIHKICPDLSEKDRKTVFDKIDGLSAYKWNVVEVAPRVYFETYILDTWGNAFVGDNYVPSRIGYCSALSDHFAILCNGDLVYCCKDYNGKTAAGNVFKNSIVDKQNSPAILSAVEGFKNFKVVHPYCQKCLGGSNWLKSVGNQL